MFPLCRSCADTLQQTPCHHAEEERVLIGSWCTPELEKAVDMGYKIQRMYEVYHWPKTSVYEANGDDKGLFAEYVNCWLKIKQEASGWPQWCKTQEDRERYIGDYYAK